MSSPKLVERFPALFWTPDEFDAPDTESVRPLRVPLLVRVKGGFTETGTKTLTRPDKPSKILLAHPGPLMETVDPGNQEPVVDIQKVGSSLVKDEDLVAAKSTLDGLLYSPLDGTTEALKRWAEEKLGGKASIIPESTPYTEEGVFVQKASDFAEDVDKFRAQIAKGLEIPEEYWNPKAGTNKGKLGAAGPCVDCSYLGAAYIDPLSGAPLSVQCWSPTISPADAAVKYLYDTVGKEAPCVYYEKKDDPD